MSAAPVRPGARAIVGTISGIVLLVGLSVLIGGPVGGLVAVVGLALAAWRGYRSVAAAALVALVVAAILTVVEAPATGEARDYLFDFALDRPWAAGFGRIAGVLALVAVVLAAVRERAPASPSATPPATDDDREADGAG